MIEAPDVTIARGGRVICHRIGMSAHPGQVVGIVGPNGSGKTTLLLALNRALRVAGGRVLIESRDISSMPRRIIARHLAVVAQETEAALPLSVRDTVALGRLASRSLLHYGDRSDQELVEAALARVELTELADRLVTELSGGERQRALIARAIAQQADHLLLDEPTNHLDLRHQFALLDLVRTLGCTTVIVLHDLNLAARCCDHILLLDAGHVVASGPPDDVLRPEILEPVYRLRVHRIDYRGRPHLIFDSPTHDEPSEETPDDPR